MRKREFDIDPALYNAPSVLVRKEIELQGLDFDEYQTKVPNRVYLPAGIGLEIMFLPTGLITIPLLPDCMDLRGNESNPQRI